MFTNDFKTSNNGVNIFVKFTQRVFEVEGECSSSYDLGILMKKVGKFLVLIDKPKDTIILKHAMKYVNFALQKDAENDVKEALPFFLKNLAVVYSSSN